MARVPDIVPISDLRQGAADLLKKVRRTGQPVVITQRGRAAAVMVSVDAYERAEHERELLRRLVRGEKEVLRGKGHDLDDVLAEADQILGK
jgi:prevent-host-death family protein